MGIRILAAMSFIASFWACSERKASISALCEKGAKGGYVLKWEVFPESEDATMEIYASDNDTIFPSEPIRTVNVNDFIAIIDDAEQFDYSYFKLKVGNTFSDVITNRLHEFENLQNFRDLGGYKTVDGRTLRWGKIFRSGEMSRITKKDKEELKKLKLESVIDLRSIGSQQKRKDLLETPNRYEIYISGASNDSISTQVLENRFLKGDAIIYMQDMHEGMFVKQNEKLAEFFDYLIDENNYPLVFHCTLGKDQSGVASYFLLKALDILPETIEDDYMFSNQGIDRSKIIKGISKMSESQQEAFAMLTRTDASYLRYGLACVKKEGGSVESFMTDSLGLTKDKREKLKAILLY